MSDHYYQHDENHRRNKIFKRLKWFLKGGGIALLIALPIVLVYANLFVAKEPEPVTSSIQESVKESSTKIFRTKFFQFQADDTWSEDADATTDTVFTYRAYRGPLIEQDLRIEINPTQTNIDATRIQAVGLNEDGSFTVTQSMSDHCDSELPEVDKDREQMLTLNDVTFMCDADDTLFDALVGLEGAGPLMRLTRPDGTNAIYTIYYRDLRALPTGTGIREVSRSFQTR